MDPRRKASRHLGMERPGSPSPRASPKAEAFIMQGSPRSYLIPPRPTLVLRQAALIDPDCPMAYWSAMANVNNAKMGAKELPQPS